MGKLNALHRTWGCVMQVARITKIPSPSKKGFDDAIAQGMARTSKTLKNAKAAGMRPGEARGFFDHRSFVHGDNPVHAHTTSSTTGLGAP